MFYWSTGKTQPTFKWLATDINISGSRIISDFYFHNESTCPWNEPEGHFQGHYTVQFPGTLVFFSGGFQIF